jgi:RNA polymerase sigma-70 factor (ECF subfamily)
MQLSDEEIIEGCLKHKRKAQKALFEKYHPLMMGICMRYAKSRPEAEDILLMGFSRIYKKMKQFGGKGSFEAWMKRIIINVAIDNFRKNLKYYNDKNIDDLHDVPLSVDEIQDHFSVAEILKTVQDLPPGYRLVFNLYAIEGYAHKEIAGMLGISESTSKSQLLKARKKLREQLAYLQQPITKTAKSYERSEILYLNPQLSFDGK